MSALVPHYLGNFATNADCEAFVASGGWVPERGGAVSCTALTAGLMYRNTTDGSLRYYDGAQWRASDRRVSSLINIKWFGAVGDGVTDCSDAVQAALDAAETAGGASAYVPEGVYLMRSSVHIAGGAGLVGEGFGSILRAATDDFHLIVMHNTSYSRITNLQMQGAAANEPGTGYHAIVAEAPYIATKCMVDHVLFSGPDATHGFNNAIKISTDCDDWQVSDCIFERLIGTHSGYGYGVLVGPCSGGIFSNSRFIGAVGQGRHAVYLSAGASQHLVCDNIVTDFAEAAFPINTYAWQGASAHNRIVGNTVIDGGSLTADAAAIGIYGKSQYNVIEGNLIVGQHASGIIVSDFGSGGLCIGNVVRGNTIIDVDRLGIAVMGTLQHSAFVINNALPVPTNTVIVGNVFLAGFGAGQAYELNGIECIMLATASDQTRASGQETDSLDFTLSGKDTLDFGVIGAGLTAELTIALAGVDTTGWAVAVTPEGTPEAGLMWCAYVSAADTVTVRLANVSAGGIDPASRVYRVQAWKYA